MNFREFIAPFFSIIHESDPFRIPKQIQMNNWCAVFMVLFNKNIQERLPFFLEIFSDNDCWQRSETIHRINLNRRVVARKMVQLRNSKGRLNPLDDYERYCLACWCSLEEDIFTLFERLKQVSEMKVDDQNSLKLFVKKLSSGHRSEPLVIYWSHVAGGCFSEIMEEGKHPYESGINYAFMFKGYVESVEFFWNKIKLLSESELSFERKREIIIQSTVLAAGKRFGMYPEIFDFCIGEVSPELYPEILRRDYIENGKYESLNMVLSNLWLDRFPKLLASVDPSYVKSDTLYDALMNLVTNDHIDYYKTEAKQLFLHIWKKEGFDVHRRIIIRKLIYEDGSLLIHLAQKDYMDQFWAILDDFPVDNIKVFMNSATVRTIGTIFLQRQDLYSVHKLASYQDRTRALQIPSTSRLEPSPTKRSKMD